MYECAERNTRVAQMEGCAWECEEDDNDDVTERSLYTFLLLTFGPFSFPQKYYSTPRKRDAKKYIQIFE